MMDSLVLRIAGLNLKLQFGRKEWFDFCSKQYLSFSSSGNGRADMSILVKAGSPENKKTAARVKYISKNTVELLFNRDIKKDFLIFNFLIKKAFAGALLLNRGVMLHASSATINGKAVLFAGESGKGKSTIVKKLNCRILANDRSILRFINGSPKVFCSPFYEQDAFKKSVDNFPLSVIFLLERRNVDRVEIKRLEEDEAIFKLIPHVVFRDGSPRLSLSNQTKLAFAWIEKLVKKINVYTLSYPLNQFSVLKKMLNENKF